MDWATDFTEDSIAKRVQVAHYHLRIAQDMAYGHFGGEMAPRRVRFAIDRAQDRLIRAVNKVVAFDANEAQT